MLTEDDTCKHKAMKIFHIHNIHQIKSVKCLFVSSSTTAVPTGSLLINCFHYMYIKMQFGSEA